MALQQHQQASPIKTNFIPEKTGNGVWWMIHIHARLRSPFFREMVQSTAENFFCDVCGSHFLDYLRKNPIPWESSKWLDWSIEFHNFVNKRKNKPILSRSDAYPLFENPKTCQSCGREKNSGIVNPQSRAIVGPNGTLIQSPGQFPKPNQQMSGPFVRAQNPSQYVNPQSQLFRSTRY